MRHVLFWLNEPTGSTTVRCQHCGVTLVEQTETDAILEAFRRCALAQHEHCKAPT